MELTRERARVSALAERNAKLVTELAALRSENIAVHKRNETLDEELTKMRKLVRTLSS
jgi:hypothetical protein